MKKRLNLLSHKKHFDWFGAYATFIKRMGTLAGIVLFILFFIIIIKIISVQKDSSDLMKKKQLYLSLLAEQKDAEANTRFFKGKLTQLNKYELDDARFVPYYTILVTAISSSTQSAVLDTVDIDKTRATTFMVKFKDYEGMISFLKYVESPDFLKNFDELSMASLNLSRTQQATSKDMGTTSKSYQLQFTGKFKSINDKTL